MSAPEPTIPQAEAAMRFFAMLATDERGSEVADALDEFCGPSHEGFVVGIVTLLNVAGAMLSTVDGDRGTWGFEMSTPFGPAAVPASTTWAARFVTAAMNGDHDTAFSLWYGAATEAEQAKQAKDLATMAIPLLRHAVKGFLATGKQLDLAAMSPWEEVSS